jgi:hypothetical protein
VSAAEEEPITLRVTFLPPFGSGGSNDGRAQAVGTIEGEGTAQSFSGWLELVSALENSLRAASTR